MSKIYIDRHTVTIGDTNMEQNVYWLNYLKWFGAAREMFLLYFIKPFLPENVSAPAFMAANDINIITADVVMQFIASSFFGDELTIEIRCFDFQPASLWLYCEIKNAKTDQLVARGKQRLVFKKLSDGKIMHIPELIEKSCREYEIASPIFKH